MTSPEPLPAHLAWINALATAMADTTPTTAADGAEEQQ